MRILQVSYERTPARTAPAGGDLGAFQNLAALAALGHEVHLAMLGPRVPLAPEVAAIPSKIHWIAPRRAALPHSVAARVFHPETLALRLPDLRGYQSALAALVEREHIDLVWSDSTFALAVSPRHAVPTVFGNYDFLFKLKRVRAQTVRARRTAPTLRKRLRELIRRPDALTVDALERLEMRLAGEAAHVMCVSASESETLIARGIRSTTIPIVGATIPNPRTAAAERPRLFLFGNHNTAHKAALAEVRTSLHAAIARRTSSPLEWHQIGRAPHEVDSDWEWMARTFDAVHGFVAELADVFRPSDISLVPYRHDTGFRTKFTVSAAYGVVSAGYPETFLCAPEFTPGEDCLVGAGPDELADEIARYATDAPRRARLAAAARALYERSYTFEGQLPAYAAILNAAVDRGPSRV